MLLRRFGVRDRRSTQATVHGDVCDLLKYSGGRPIGRGGIRQAIGPESSARIMG